MVGVPGRSKGCRTCRRRKKGCDQLEPSCSQCLAAGLLCEGYGRDLVWVNATTSASIRLRRPPPSSSPPAPWHVRHAAEPGIVLRDSLAASARQQKYLGLFWAAYLPNGRAFTSRACRLSTGGWTAHMGRLYDAEPTLRLAALAMSASVVGHQHGDQQLVVTGLKTYSAALGEMAAAAASEERRLGDGLLAAARLMEFYEILFGSDTGRYPDARLHVDGWRGHNNGQMSLVLARGPARLQSGTGHQLFADGRLNMVVGDIARRKRSRLATPQWKQGPWKTQRKSIKDKLMDILVDIPGLLEDLDTVKGTEDPDAKEEARQRALVACKACHHHLTVWEDEVGDDLFVYDYVVSGVPLPVPKTDIDTALLQMTSLYWVVCILLYSTTGLLMRERPQLATPQPNTGPPSYLSPPASVSPLASVCPPASVSPLASVCPPASVSPLASVCPPASVSPPTSVSSPSAGPPSDSRSPTLCAYKIAHAVHLFWEPAAGAFGNHVGLFPLGVAMRFLAGTEPIETSDAYQRMRALFRRPFLGTHIGAFLANLQREAPSARLRAMQGDEGIQARAHAWWHKSGSAREQA